VGAVGRIEQLAQWWSQATNEARFELLTKATKENSPAFAELRLAIILSELEAGTVSEGQCGS